MPRRAASFHQLDQSRFYAIHSRAVLADRFGLTRETLKAILEMERPYSIRPQTTGRNGKTKIRTIQEPRGALRPIHITVRKALSRIEPPEFLFCPVKRRSYIGNAAQHVSSREVRKLDIEAYFPSTPRTRVFWFFHTIMRCSEDVASVLAQLLTVDEHLATGSTVSPILSFFAFYDMWTAIGRIAKVAGCPLSVYVDDMTISGDNVPERVMWEIKKQIRKCDLKYHKECRFTRGVGEVTGAVIKNGQLLVPNRQHKKAYDTRTALVGATAPDEVARLSAVLRGLNEQRRQVEQTTQSARRTMHGLPP